MSAEQKDRNDSRADLADDAIVGHEEGCSTFFSSPGSKNFSAGLIRYSLLMCSESVQHMNITSLSYPRKRWTLYVRESVKPGDLARRSGLSRRTPRDESRLSRP